MPASREQAFEAERGRLTGLAYRMLGSLADAEDAVQDTWLRWQNVDMATVERPGSFLSSILTRLCLDRLKSARHRREIYVGPWLPEPLLEDPALASVAEGTLAKDVSFALMLALERLSPLERAAFLLHDVFDMAFTDVADILGRNETTCRKLASRARNNVRSARPRFAVPETQGAEIASAFFAAARSGDVQALGQLLGNDATLHGDGGGKKISVLNVITGSEKIVRLFAGLAGKPDHAPPRYRVPVLLNGMPGELSIEADGTRQASALDIRAGIVQSIYIIRNPYKLVLLWEKAGLDQISEAVN
ncbi:sigma-70 family RNA polymerase sigma factor [Roseibium hamelinense]|nr:sigma-70 family RNA polymerase sigma factor [Roseibium hamelinense]